MATINSLNDLENEGKKIKGKWALGKNHALSYSLEDETATMTLDSSLVAAEAGALVVSVTESFDDGRRVTGLARLTGNWRVNDRNEIEFEVSRRAAKSDVLTFKGNWALDKKHQILYTYKTTARKLKRGKRETTVQTLVFKGWWDLSEKTRLTYLIEGSSDSAFRLQGTFQSPSIRAKRGELRYQLGVEGKGKRGKLKTITLFGKWQLSDKLGLSFEMEYAGGVKHEMRFGAVFALTEDLEVAVNLTGKQREPLGVEVILTKSFLDHHASAFVKLRKTLRASAVEAGVSIPW
jgi:hypothetical protein